MNKIKTFFSNLFTAQYIGLIIINVITIFAAVYTNNTKPLTAAETLKRENLLNGKKDIYNEAIQLVIRMWAENFQLHNAVPADNPINRNVGSAPPTELEVNSCFAKLCIYSDNPRIPIQFRRLISPRSYATEFKIAIDPIVEITRFMNLIKEDLGYGQLSIDSASNDYRYIIIYKPMKDQVSVSK